MKLKKYKGENLKQIKFLLGGIGTGNVSLEGRGTLTDWEIFNRPGKGKNLYGNFVFLYVKSLREEPKFKVVAKTPFPPYESSYGLPNFSMEGYPFFEDAEFINFFPFAIINFLDKNFPLKVSLKAYFDVGNVLINGFPEQWIRILGKLVKRIHLKDFKTSVGNITGFCYLLEGDVNWPEVIKALKEVGYNSYLTAEFGPYKFYPETSLLHLSTSIDKILGK